jgi:hypothetical protein
MSTLGSSRRGRLRCSEWRGRGACLASAPPGAALRASRWSRLGNEGEDPGACCALSCAAGRRARVFRNTLGRGGANCSGSASFSGANPEQFGTTSSSPRHERQTPGGSRAASARGRQSLLASLPHCRNATTKPSGERSPAARTRGRPTPNHKAASHAATTPAPSASTESPQGSTSAAPRGRSPSPASSAPSPRSSAPPAPGTSAIRSASR